MDSNRDSICVNIRRSRADLQIRAWGGSLRLRHYGGLSIPDGVNQDVSLVVPPSCARRSSDKFQGRNGSMSAGGLPPAAAQL